MRGKVLGLGLWVLVASAGCGTGWRTPPDLTAADTAMIFAAALDTIRQGGSVRFHSDGVIWVMGTRAAQRDAPLKPVSDAVWDQFTTRLPQALRAGPEEELFECPPGEEVMMPGNGCPIRGNGVITTFEGLEVKRNKRATLLIFLVHSAEDGRWTQMIGEEVQMSRAENNAWEVTLLRHFMET